MALFEEGSSVRIQAFLLLCQQFYLSQITHYLSNPQSDFHPHDGASVLARAYQLKVRSQNPKDFEHWFSQRLWVKFTMFLLNSTSVDAGAIIGACHGTSVDACAIYGGFRFLLFSLTTSFCLFLVRYKHASGDARYLGCININLIVIDHFSYNTYKKLQI